MNTITLISLLIIFFLVSLYSKRFSKKSKLFISISVLLFFVAYSFIEPNYKFESIFFSLIALSIIIKNLKIGDRLLRKSYPWSQ